MREFPEDKIWLFRRAHDEYVLAADEKDEYYLRCATKHYRELYRKFPDEDIYKSRLAELLFMQGEKDEAFALAYKCKEKDYILKKILEGEALEAHKRTVLRKKFNAFFYELYDYNTLESLEFAEKFLILFSCDHLLWQVYGKRTKIYQKNGDEENFKFCKKEAERLAKVADENGAYKNVMSASEQLATWF